MCIVLYPVLITVIRCRFLGKWKCGLVLCNLLEFVTYIFCLIGCGPLYKHVLTSNPAWLSNHMSNKEWDKIIYPFRNFNGRTVEVWEWISDFIYTHLIMGVITYVKMSKELHTLKQQIFWPIINTEPHVVVYLNLFEYILIGQSAS